jgi:hypothetical protein
MKSWSTHVGSVAKCKYNCRKKYIVMVNLKELQILLDMPKVERKVED